MSESTLDLGFALRGGRTALVRRVFRWPYVVMRPFRLDAAPAHMATVVVQSSGAALQRGDRLRQRIGVGEGAAAHVTTQGAQAVHAAADDGRGAEETVALHVASGGYLEYLPEPRVLFPDADLASHLDVDCSGKGLALVADAFAWHDPEGAGRTPRRLRSTMTIRIDGGEAACVDRAEVTHFAPQGADYVAFGVMALIAPERVAPTACGELNAAFSGIDGLYAAASPLPGSVGLGCRFAGRDLRALRAGFAATWRWSRLWATGVAPAARRRTSEVL